MKKIICILLIIAFSSLAIMSINIKRFWIRQNTYVSQILWHENECYIFVCVNTSGWSGNYLKELFISATELIGIPPHSFKKLREDTIIYHFFEGKINKFYIKNFECSGFSPYKGIIHKIIGGDPPSVWRWTGLDFEKLAQDDSKQIRNSFKLAKDLLSKEGWAGYELEARFQEGKKQLPVKLKSYDLNFILIADKYYDNKEIILKEIKNFKSENIIAEKFTYSLEKIDEKAYFDFEQLKLDR